MEDENFFEHYRHKDLSGVKKFDFKKVKAAKLPKETVSPLKNGLNSDSLVQNKSQVNSTRTFGFKALFSLSPKKEATNNLCLPFKNTVSSKSYTLGNNSDENTAKIHNSAEPMKSPDTVVSSTSQAEVLSVRGRTDTILDSLYKNTVSNKKGVDLSKTYKQSLNSTVIPEISLSARKNDSKLKDLEGSPSLLSGRAKLTLNNTLNISKYFNNENTDNSKSNDSTHHLTPFKKLLGAKKSVNICDIRQKFNIDEKVDYSSSDVKVNSETSLEYSKPITISDSSSTTTDSPILKPKKFVFKKKPLISSSSFSQEKSSFDEVFNKNQDTSQSVHSNSDVISKPMILYSTPTEGQSRTNDYDVLNCNKSASIRTFANTDVITSKEESRNSPSNHKVEDKFSLSQSLEVTNDDYMDDDEFERRFGCLADQIDEDSVNSKEEDAFNNSTLKESHVESSIKLEHHNTEELLKEISNINWDNNCFEEEPIQEGFKDRDDDSEEFKGNYEHSEVMLEMLHQKFGLRSFRPHQREVINASLKCYDCFVLMPTGGGKSLCYQLPAVLMPGVTVVISPLRALISDQVDKLTALDIAAAHLCSDVSKAECEQIYMKLSMREPAIKLLYLTPEKINASRVIIDMLHSLYQRGKLARFVIDEVHCLSQWGHDFRPDYKELSRLRKNFKDVPIICLTATATKQVEQDVINILGLKQVKRFIRSFNRPNIKYQVIPKKGKEATKEIANLIKSKFAKQSGIVYCLSRQDCDNMAENFNTLGIKSKPYHAGMNDKVREVVQREWMQDRFHVIVATIAFGMGIDKPDVRFVIHNSIPKSVEAFYQESGRAGRDGEVSYSYLFYSYFDVSRLQKLMQMDRNISKKTLDAHKENLKQMVSFAENVVDCRRHLQLLHLGEHFDRRICIRNKATICDNCENIDNYKTVDVTKAAKEMCTIVKDLTSCENVTMLYVADVYRGSKMKKILDRGHNKHPQYGTGSTMDRNDVQRILKEMILKRILADFCTYTGDFPVVYIKTGPKFYQFFNSESKLEISVCTNKQPAKREGGVKVNAAAAAAAAALENGNLKSDKSNDWVNVSKPSTSAAVVRHTVQKQTTAKLQAARKLQLTQLKVQCHEELLEECRRLAMERNLTLSSVMNLSAIKTMSEMLPNSKEEMLKIQHVTNANYNKYGDFFLKITQKFRTKHDALLPLAVPSTLSADEHKVEDSLSDNEYHSDFYPSSSQGRTSGGTNRGVKRKRGWGAKRGRGFKKKKAKATSSSGWKGKMSKGGKGGCKRGGKLGLMPLHIK